MTPTIAAHGTPAVSRGQVWWADLGLSEKKRLVVVSNNQRNRNLRDVVGIYVTTKPKPDMPSIARFSAGEVGPAECWVLADQFWQIHKKHLVERIGALTPGQMLRVDEALRAALGL